MAPPHVPTDRQTHSVAHRVVRVRSPRAPRRRRQWRPGRDGRYPVRVPRCSRCPTAAPLARRPVSAPATAEGGARLPTVDHIVGPPVVSIISCWPHDDLRSRQDSRACTTVQLKKAHWHSKNSTSQPRSQLLLTPWGLRQMTRQTKQNSVPPLPPLPRRSIPAHYSWSHNNTLLRLPLTSRSPLTHSRAWRPALALAPAPATWPRPPRPPPQAGNRDGGPCASAPGRSGAD